MYVQEREELKKKGYVQALAQKVADKASGGAGSWLTLRRPGDKRSLQERSPQGGGDGDGEERVGPGPGRGELRLANCKLEAEGRCLVCALCCRRLVAGVPDMQPAWCGLPCGLLIVAGPCAMADTLNALPLPCRCLVRLMPLIWPGRWRQASRMVMPAVAVAAGLAAAVRVQLPMTKMLTWQQPLLPAWQTATGLAVGSRSSSSSRRGRWSSSSRCWAARGR